MSGTRRVGDAVEWSGGVSCNSKSRNWVYPGFPTLFWGLSGFFVDDLMGKALWKLVENAQRFPRCGGRVLCVHGAGSFHRAHPYGDKIAASSDCSRPVNDYVHIEAADLCRPNARFTQERQGYQVLTPFGKLGYSPETGGCTVSRRRAMQSHAPSPGPRSNRAAAADIRARRRHRISPTAPRRRRRSPRRRAHDSAVRQTGAPRSAADPWPAYWNRTDSSRAANGSAQRSTVRAGPVSLKK